MQWIYAKGVAKRTQISVGGVQGQDTLIQQSLNYSNRTFIVSNKHTSCFCYGIFPNLPATIQAIKCIGLFKRLDPSTCVAITGTSILNSGTQFPLKMFSYSISYHSNFKIFQFQHYYSIMHTIVRGCIMYLVV